MDPHLDPLLHTHQIRFVRITWCDNAGVIRAKAVHTTALPECREHGIGITLAQQALPVMADTVVAETGLGPVGEIRLVPDWGTLVPLPYAPGHARVLGDMCLDGKPWPLCPRNFLSRMIDRAAREGIEMQAAFENEFYLFRPTDTGFAPVDDTVFAATWSMDQHHVIIDDLTEALIAQGIPVQMYYPESGPGQQELSTRHTTALAAADRQILFRETARAIALRHGLRACFLPKPLAQHAGSGAHVHFSLWRDGRNLLPDPAGTGGLSAIGRAAVAGILADLPALMALTTPSTNSYRRLLPGCWSGAFAIWGVDNREAAVRVPSAPEGTGSTNIELKTADATCNPHLALGAILAVALQGVRNQRDPDNPVQVDPATLDAEQRSQRHITLLPRNLQEALTHLESDAILRDAMGEDLFRAFLAVRWAEWQALGTLDLADEVRLLWERY
jgi:glutamine synthetase